MKFYDEPDEKELFAGLKKSLKRMARERGGGQGEGVSGEQGDGQGARGMARFSS